jgi:xanthine dehydrogenase accessory factor
MDRSTDSEVIASCLDWLANGSEVYLATVVETWGSAPRRPGALMAIHPDGRFVGSVSGGCVEDDLAQQVLRGDLEQDLPRLLSYGVTSEQVQRVGLPCGGRLRLLVERCDSPAPFKQLQQAMQSGRLLARHVCLATGEASLRPAVDETTFQFDDDNLVKVFGPRWRMLLVGAGELSRRVAQLAMTLDYAVTVFDSRPEYADGWQVEGADFVSAPVADALTAQRPDRRSVVLALSHTPKLDDAALAVALQGEVFYVGALGSLKNQQARLRRLQKLGLDPAQLSRLHGPVGLDLGSRTPAEIAVAIIAALIAERSKLGRGQAVPISVNA